MTVKNFTYFLLAAALVFPIFTKKVLAESFCNQWPQALKEAEEIRGIASKDPVKCLELSKSEFAKQLSNKPKDKQELIYEEVIFKTLGLIPSDFNYADCAAKEKQNFLLAYYDTKTKTVLINSDSDFSFDILVHEAVHALQDQEFDLYSLGESASKATDSALAFSALVEGDAMLSQQLYLSSKAKNVELKKQESKQTTSCAYPRMYENLSLFPYTFGKIFSVREYEKGGFKSIDKIFLNPPQTTREIIHSSSSPFNSKTISTDKKKLEKDLNLRVKKQVYSDSFGQYFVRSLLGTSLPDNQAIISAAGWGGDKIELYTTGKTSILALSWKLVWEDEKQAMQFRKAFMRHLSRLLGRKLPDNAKKMNLNFPDGRKYFLEESGSEVFIAAAGLNPTKP